MTFHSAQIRARDWLFDQALPLWSSAGIDAEGRFVEKLDFELWSTAVSAINGCGACLDAHEGELRKHGVPNVQIQAALRIGAVVHAASRIVASEAALAG